MAGDGLLVVASGGLGDAVLFAYVCRGKPIASRALRASRETTY
jgi:hypothetical protein